MKKGLVTRSGNDVVYTPDGLASALIEYFNISGKVLEPCKGNGAFSDKIPNCDWCEITEGVDFLTYEKTGYDWIITNPPWSKYRLFLNKAFKCADNIVFIQLVNAIFMKARLRDTLAAGFSIKEILILEEPKEKNWPKTGFQLGAVHFKKGYSGDIKFTTDFKISEKQLSIEEMLG